MGTVDSLKKCIKLGQYNVERGGEELTIPLYMEFLVEDKIADVIIPNIDLNLLSGMRKFSDS